MDEAQQQEEEMEEAEAEEEDEGGECASPSLGAGAALGTGSGGRFGPELLVPRRCTGSNFKRRINEEARIRHFGWSLVHLPAAYPGAAASHCWVHPVHGRASSKKQIFRFHSNEPPIKQHEKAHVLGTARKRKHPEH